MTKATAQFPPLYHLWISKHISGFAAFGNMMEHRHEWDHSHCPCCNFIREDKNHFLTCPDPSCTDTWLMSLAGFEAWMIDVDTALAIRLCLLRTLSTRSSTQSFAALSDPLLPPPSPLPRPKMLLAGSTPRKGNSHGHGTAFKLPTIVPSTPPAVY